MGFLSAPATDIQITHASRIWLYGLAGVIMVFLAAPALLVAPMSFTASTFLQFPPREYSLRWYENYFGSQLWIEATYVSLKVATLSTILATPLGTAAAYGLFVAGFRWTRLVFLLLVSPMLVPVILIAIGVFFLFVPLRLNNTIMGLTVAHTALGIPFVFVLVTAGLKTFDMNQEMVARSLGASRLRAFLSVTAPQIRFSIISGALFAFIHSFDEVIVAFFLSTGDMSTLTRRMFLALEYAIDPTIAAISTLLIVFSVVGVVAIQLLGTFRQRPNVP